MITLALLSLWIGIIASLVVIYQVFISPLLKLRFYKNQGAKVMFFPIVGYSPINPLPVLLKRDLFAYDKQIVQQNPDIKAIATNVYSTPLIEIVDIPLLKEFLKNQDVYDKATYLFGLLGPIHPLSLNLIHGPRWHKVRAQFNQKLNKEEISARLPILQDACRNMFEKLSQDSPENIDLKKMDVLRMSQKISGEMTGKLFFGDKFDTYDINKKSIQMEYAELQSHGVSMFSNPIISLFGPRALNYSPWPPHQKLLRRIENFRKKCLDILRENKELYQTNKLEKNALISLFFDTQKDSNGEITETEVLDSFLLMFADGINTIAHGILMVLYHISMHPECIPKIEEEIQNNYDKEFPVKIENLDDMRYTDAAIRESLRLSPPIAQLLIRESKEDHNIGDLKIKKGTFVNHHMIHNLYNPKYFDEPEKFNVDRWLDPNSKTLKADPLCFIPFSEGPRICMGQHANINFPFIKIFISELARKYQFKIVEGQRLTMTWKFCYEPAHPIRFMLTDKVPH